MVFWFCFVDYPYLADLVYGVGRTDLTVLNALTILRFRMYVFIFRRFNENVYRILIFVCVMGGAWSIWVHTDASRMHMSAYGCMRMHLDA